MAYVGTDTEWMLDRAAKVARSWKLVSFGTAALTAAILLVVLAFAKPTYTARMVLPLSPQVEALIGAGIIAPGVSVSKELATNTRLFALSVSGTDPQATQSELQKAFDQIVTASKPPPSLRLRILSDIDANQRALAELRGLKESTLRSTTLVRTEIENIELRISKLQLLLDGIRPDEVPQQPGPAIESWQPLSLRTALVAFLFSLSLMSAIALVRARR
jgi:uncharacterized protein involved in exopolysaccharide biosynthesis